MSGVKHTPGPWRTNGCYISSNYGEVGHAYFVSSMPEGMADANAYLIASAPDLLEALPDLTHVITWLRNGCEVKHAITELEIYQRRIDAAITHATGDRPEKGEQE